MKPQSKKQLRMSVDVILTTIIIISSSIIIIIMQDKLVPVLN
jgi:hypothetical protein